MTGRLIEVLPSSAQPPSPSSSSLLLLLSLVHSVEYLGRYARVRYPRFACFSRFRRSAKALSGPTLSTASVTNSSARLFPSMPVCLRTQWTTT